MTDSISEALFSPGVVCRERLELLIASARETIDVCVYTITDDRLARPLLRAFAERDVAVRIITETDKMADRGSDIARFEAAGIPVATDTDTQFMHHKFAIFDDRVLASGSFNWTASATGRNHENLIVTSDPGLVDSFRDEFERLWQIYGRTL